MRADGQPQAGAAHRIGARVGLEERLEQMRLVFTGNADTGIGHLPLQPAALLLPACRNAHHHAPAVGELQRVADQVVEHLADPRGITAHPGWHVGIDAGVELQPLVGGRGSIRVERILGQPHRIERAGLQAQLPGLGLADIEDVADQLHQGRGRTLDRCR
jgi:hypothetical protein